MTFQQYPSKLGIPSGNTAGRPTNPVIGDTYYNGQLEILEIWNGTTFVAVSAPPSTPQITSVTDASTGDAYTSTAGKLAVVFVAGSGGGTPSQYNAFTVAGGHSASSSGTTITLTGLTPGTSYEVYGNGQNNFGTTVNTPNQAAVTPTTLPEVRTIGTATASTSTNEVTVTWTNGNNGGKNLSAITITPFLNGTTAQTSRTAATTSSTSYTFTEGQLTAGAAYTFKVKATNANGTSADSTASNSATVPSYFLLEYLVIAGGGGGGSGSGPSVWGGGGAGGYRTASGFTLNKNTNYNVEVGAGGAIGTNGVNSVFSTITSIGGGRGGGTTASGVGGSGGGGASDGSFTSGNIGTANQGNSGGGGNSSGEFFAGGGGGGAGQQGGTGSTSGASGGNGGNGTASSITGTSVTRGGGGAGGARNASGSSNNQGIGGTGGGGNGGFEQGTRNGSAGTPNTGGGGGGGHFASGASAAGGSGVVILRYLTSDGTITIGAGLTGTTATDGSYKVTTLTAGTGNVSWS